MKSNKELFIEKARIVHGNKYDYSKVEYVNSLTKVCIICPKHGEFWQPPKNHLNGYGCQLCAQEQRVEKNRGSKEGFISRAIEIFGDTYDYSRVEYVNSDTPVCIVCRKHGEFWQTPTRHLNSKGCPQCTEERRGSDKRYTTEKFVSISRALYGEKFGYDKTVYKNSRTPVIVTCPVHGDVEMLPSYHIHVNGCPRCASDLLKDRRETAKEEQRIQKEEKERILSEEKERNFIEKATAIHNGLYRYDNVRYVNSTTPVSIICPVHGEFKQMPSNHLRGCGCPKCALERIGKALQMGQEEFIARAREIHGDKYDYSKVVYGKNNREKVCIICPKHGEFWQEPNMHINERQGCPVCGVLSSKCENEIFSFVKSCLANVIVEQRNKTVLDGRELDIYIPSMNFAIEYNGLRWHSEEFNGNKYKHLSKTEECERKGIRLIQIFEDEWIYKNDIVREKIAHILGCSNADRPKVYGRNCDVMEIGYELAKDFLDKYHIQGGKRSTAYLGGYYRDELVGVMIFLKNKDEYVLDRFATNYNYNIVGIGGKIFSYFVQKYDPLKIVTYGDRRWHTSDDNLYTKIGFRKDMVLPPNYMYVTPQNSYRKRYHKFNFRKKNLHKKYGFPMTMTEREMTNKLKYYKIWDCGLVKYVWEKEEKR